MRSSMTREDEIRALLPLIDLNRRAGRLHAAGRWIRQLEQTAPDHPELPAIRLRQLAAGQGVEALRVELGSLARSPERRLDALAIGATLLAYSGDPDAIRQARLLFERYIAARPARVEGYLGLALACEQQKDIPAAHRAYLQALAVDPRHPRVLNNLAWFLARRLHAPHEALSFAQAAVLEAPDDPHRLNTRGAILFDMGRLHAARADLERSVAQAVYLPATRAESLAMLAQIYERLGRMGDARRCAGQAIELDRRHHVLSPEMRDAVERLTTEGT